MFKSTSRLFGSPSPFCRHLAFDNLESIFKEAPIPSFYKSISYTLGLVSPKFSFLPLIMNYLHHRKSIFIWIFQISFQTLKTKLFFSLNSNSLFWQIKPTGSPTWKLLYVGDVIFFYQSKVSIVYRLHKD